jgi:hypothetical protein
MSKKQFVLWTLGLATLVLLLAGCAKAPTQEIEAAQSAFAEAEAADAASYAPEQWQAAQTTFNAAQAKIEEQNGKLGLTRSYDEAKELLAQAATEAAAARDAAAGGREAARTGGEAALGAVETSLANAQTLLGDLDRCPRKPKGFAVDLAELRGKVEGLGTQAADARTSLGQERYLEAKTMAEAAQSEAAALVGDLQSALGKLGCPSSVATPAVS